jgi:glycosyltransferase involved in cell wall biosynthesis
VSAPAVTVILPVYNAERYLPEALDSVLAQDFADFELLAIDDGSTDASRQILQACRDPRLRVLQNPRNLGLTSTLQRGLLEARAPVIARQDADDVSLPTRLRLQHAHLGRSADTVLVGTQAVRTDGAGRPRAPLDHGREHGTLCFELLFDNAFFHTAAAFRRDAARAAGGYDAAFAYCQDYDLWSRLARQGRVANLPERLVRVRAHATSMTATMAEVNREETRRVIARNLEALGAAFSPDDAQTLADARSHPGPVLVARWLELVPRLLSAYERVDPAAVRSRDFADTLGRLYAGIAMSARPRSVRPLLAGARRAPVLRALGAHAVRAALFRLQHSSRR